MAEQIKLSERSHPLYGDNVDKWELYRDAAKGGDSFITEENLKTHRLEETDDYTERTERAYFLNYCDAIPTVYNSYIFRGKIERKPDDLIEAFRTNVDGKGTHITDFMKKLGYLASIYGVVHVLVDIPESKKENPSIADVKNEEITPYCTIITPIQLKDWSVDERGEFNWILIETTYLNDLDPTMEREEELHYKLITREEWKVVDEDDAPVNYEDDTPNSGSNDLGFIPMHTLYHKDLMDDKIGESLIKDIVYVNRAIFNWCSCIDEQIERQTFSQLTVPDDGSLAEEDGKDPLLKIGTSSIWTFNSDSKHPPAFISPDTENLTTVWKLIQDHVKEMFRLAGLQGGTSDLYTSKSGRQSQMNFLGVNSALAEKSRSYEKAENMISKIAYAQLGGDSSSYEDVRYPTSFDVVALEEEIDGYLKVMERNFSETFNKTLMKEISRKAIPLALTTTQKEIETEIDAGDGVVEPLTSMGPEQEKDGDGNTNSNMEKSYKTSQQSSKEESGKRKTEE